jgi:hypothetical protein
MPVVEKPIAIKPELLAETLFTELLQRQHCDIPAHVHVEPESIPAIESKIRLYQFSSVLLAVIATAQTKPEFLPVQDHLERLFFPPTAQQGAGLLMDVRGAMKDLSELLDLTEENGPNLSSKTGRSMSWARNWLASAGIDEHNPAILALFALNWMHYYIMVTKSLSEFSPVA